MQKRKAAPGRRKARASTKDVVGQAPIEPRVNPRWRKYYNRLIELPDHLLRERFELTQDVLEENPKFGTHLADAGTDSYDRDLALSSEQEAVYEIESLAAHSQRQLWHLRTDRSAD
jgi:hypothetical protein